MIKYAFLFAPGYGIYWLIGVLVVLLIYKWKTVLMGLLYLLLLPLMFPIAFISAFFQWEPKFIKRWEKNVEDFKKKNQ